MWSALKGLGSALFGTDSGKKVVDAVIDTGDALFHTDEEKTEANRKALELKIEFAKATTGSRLARRVLAFMFCGTFLLMVVTAVGLGLAGQHEKAAFVLEITKDTLVLPVSAIVGFYFFTQMVRK